MKIDILTLFPNMFYEFLTNNKDTKMQILFLPEILNSRLWSYWSSQCIRWDLHNHLHKQIVQHVFCRHLVVSVRHEICHQLSRVHIINVSDELRLIAVVGCCHIVGCLIDVCDLDFSLAKIEKNKAASKCFRPCLQPTGLDTIPTGLTYCLSVIYISVHLN